MDTVKINQLKIAANQFYLNKYMELPTLSDAEYDLLVDEYLAEGGSVFDLVEWEDDINRVHEPLPKVSKDQVIDNDLSSAVNNWINAHNIENGNYHLNYKYDGSSIIAYYTPSGRLYRVLGTPDCVVCLDRTKNCFNMFPHQVTPGIECIQGEFLVDSGAYGERARNKANGLLDSKVMINDIENEGFIRAYQMRFFDGNWSYKRLRQELNNLPIMARDRIRPYNIIDDKVIVGTRFDAYFAPAEMIDAPTESIITESGIYVDDDLVTDEVKFQVDGAVIYYGNTEDFSGYHAFKFYFTDIKETIVTNIIWNKSDSDSWQPKLNFNSINLNDKNISQAASGGYPNLSYMKMGKGAKIKVILANLTIPKVIKVIEPSDDYQFPTCECGHLLNPLTDLFGSGLKCTELDCSERYNRRKTILDAWIAARQLKGESITSKDLAKSEIFNLLNAALNIDRWNASTKLIDKSLTSELLYSELESLTTPDDFKSWMYKRFSISGLCDSIFKINYYTAYRVIKEFINN